MEEGIYNEEEYKKALAWAKKYCKEGRDDNPDFVRFTREQKDKQWEFVVKMYCIIKDLNERQSGSSPKVLRRKW